MADAPDSGSGGATRGGSNPLERSSKMIHTMKKIFYGVFLFFGLGLILIFSVLMIQGLKNTWKEKWQTGTDWGGDLKQHYAAGITLKKQDYSILYRGFHFGPILAETFHKEDAAPIAKFNYRYCPLVAWFSEKMTFFSYNFWLDAWLAASILFYVAAFFLLKKICAEISFSNSLTTLYFFAFPPFLYNLSIFQNSALTFLIFAGIAVFLRKEKDFLGGLLLSCAFYKPQFAPYIGTFMLLARRWKFISGLIAGGMFWFLLSVLLCGWQAHVDYLGSIMETLRGIQDDEMGTNIPWKGFILTVFPENWQPSAQVAMWIVSLLFLIVLPLILRRYEKENSWPADYVFWMSVLFWMIFSPHVKSYEMILGMGWWLIFTSLVKENPKWFSLSILFWLIGALAVAARFIGASLAAPMLTLWFAVSIWFLIRSFPETRRGQTPMRF